VLTIVDRKVTRWRGYLDPVAVLMRSGGRQAHLAREVVPEADHEYPTGELVEDHEPRIMPSIFDRSYGRIRIRCTPS
jgi:hypothetical protein